MLYDRLKKREESIFLKFLQIHVTVNQCFSKLGYIVYIRLLKDEAFSNYFYSQGSAGPIGARGPKGDVGPQVHIYF